MDSENAAMREAIDAGMKSKKGVGRSQLEEWLSSGQVFPMLEDGRVVPAIQVYEKKKRNALLNPADTVLPGSTSTTPQPISRVSRSIPKNPYSAADTYINIGTEK